MVTPLDLGDHALEALAVVDVRIDRDLDLVGHAGLGQRQLDQRHARLRRQEDISRRKVVDVGIGLVGLLVDLEAVLQSAHPKLPLAEGIDVQLGDQDGVDDDLVQSTLLDGRAEQREMAVVERIVRAEEQTDPALRRRERAKIRQQADNEQRAAQAEPQEQECLPGAGHPGRAQSSQGDVDQDPDQRIAVRIADTPCDEIAAEILRSLRRQGRDDRRAGYAAHGRHPKLVERTPP